MLSKDYSRSGLSKSINTRLSRFTDQSTETAVFQGSKESAQSFSLVSDHMHYLSKTVIIPDWFRTFSFYFLCFQIIVIGFVPQLESYWRDTSFRNLSNLVGIVALIQTPPLDSDVFTVFLAIDIGLILFEMLLSLIVRMIYARSGHVRPSLCYLSRYTSLLMATIFLQTSAAFCGGFIGHTFSRSASFFKICLSILVVIVVVLGFVRALWFLILTHYTVSYTDQIFLVQKANAVARVYASLFVQVFAASVLRQDSRVDIIVPWIIFLISFTNFWIDLLRSPWGRNAEYRVIVTVWASSWGTALIYSLDRTNKSYDATDVDFWLSMGWLTLCFLIIPSFCRLVIRKALKRLDDPEFPIKASSAAAAIRDMRIGFRMGHQGTMECVHIRELFERFPNDQDLLLFCSKVALTLTECPYTLEELENSLAANNSFSLIKSHFNKSLVRMIPPSSAQELERYNKHVIQLHSAFINLLDDARTLYDVIIDEMAAIFSKVMNSYQQNYHKALRTLFGFMERYPFSPDGDFFLEVFSILYPNTSEMMQMSAWQSSKPDYVRQHLTYFPRQLPAVVNHPQLFRSYTPEYKVRRKNFPTIPPSLHAVEQTRKSKGPYASIVTKWYVMLLLGLILVFPTVAMALIIAQNDRFIGKTELLAQGWSLTWLLKRSESFLYPILFFNSDHPFWMGYEVLRNQFFKDYAANMTLLQQEVLKFGYGIGGLSNDIALDLLGSITDFMNTRVDSLQGTNMSIAQIFLMTTFLGNDAVAQDYVLVPTDLTDNAKMTLVNLINEHTDLIIEKLRNFLVTPASTNSDNYYMSTIAFLVISVVLLVIAYIVIVWLFLGASSKFDVFFKTLRDTSKAAVASMRQFIRLCQSVMGLARRRGRVNRYRKGRVNFMILAIVANLIIGLVLIALCLLLYFAAHCRVTQADRLLSLYSDYASGYNNLSATIREAFLRKFAGKNPQETWEKTQELFDLYQQNMWDTYDQGNVFCRLCSTVDIYHLYTAAGLTYEKLIFNYMVLMRFYMLPDSDSDPRAETVWVQTMQIWYLQIVYALTNFATRVVDTCASFYVRTRTLEIVFCVTYLVFALIFISFFAYSARLLDMPFQNIVQLFCRFPDAVLSQDSLRIMRQNNWSFTSSEFVFESAMYDAILERLPDCLIIIDVQGVILLHNIAAQRIIDINEAAGKRLFDQLIMTLTTIEDSTEETGSGEEEVFEPERFETVLNTYMSEDRNSIFVTKLMGLIDNQKSWFSLTVLPIYPEASDLMLSHNENADRFALVFRDIGDEIRQQNLVAEETRKHLQIVHQILPTEIATRLLKEQRSISMTVEKVAISFCDIVQFTPWCGSQPAENVVTALNYMFNLFDERCSRYETVTKIKCIGDCYMSAAGIFSNAAGPEVFGVEMVRFCLDLIDAIGVVNEKLGTSLMVRIGVALGGPISAGVMGIHKPVFDIWGEAVNDAQNLESGGCPMKVHINQELKDCIDAPDINIEPKGDGTYFCTRKVESESD